MLKNTEQCDSPNTYSSDFGEPCFMWSVPTLMNLQNPMRTVNSIGKHFTNWIIKSLYLFFLILIHLTKVNFN